MGWVIVLAKRPNGIQSQLLFSYLVVMLTLIGGAIVGVYAFTRHSLYEQLDQRLENLAQAAAPSLVPFKVEADEGSDRSADSTIPPSKPPDDDGDLDIPWQDLRETKQGIEWFDAQKRLVGKAGTVVTAEAPQPGYGLLLEGIRAVTLTVYAGEDASDSQEIEGYIRTRESTAEVSDLLRRFRWGLGIGGGTLLGLTAIGGIWLTRQSLRPIEKSFQQLKQFTGDAAHELRSPLATLKTSVQVMQCYPERIHPKDRQKVAAIATTTDQMIQLVEDLLLLSRMDENSVGQTQQWTLVSISPLLSELLSLLNTQAQSKQIKLQSALKNDISVMGDALQLQRLFRNLIENAIQYTPSGGEIEVSVSVVGQWVCVSVEDTGIGIAEEVRSLVFDRFWRADEARDRRTSGMGMGLSIAQKIAERHRGKITVTSQLGRGSCFQVSLPLA